MNIIELQRLIRDYLLHGQPRINGRILRKIHSLKIESGRNKK